MCSGVNYWLFVEAAVTEVMKVVNYNVQVSAWMLLVGQHEGHLACVKYCCNNF